MKTQSIKTKSLLALAFVALLMIPQLAHAEKSTKRKNPFANQIQTTFAPADSDAIAHANQLSKAFRAVSSKVLATLVAIETHNDSARVSNDQRANPFSSPSSTQPTAGIGSGVIIDASGIILTNSHVVMGGKGRVTVRLNDGREYPAAEVLTDPISDIAVIRIEGVDNLQASPMANSDRAEIGDWVLALGQPFGLESTVTAGIISAKQRGIGMNERESYIQTDAAINPGNSGGPLVNLNGEVVGINTAISSRSGGNEGIGFAIPINLARWVGGQLMEHGQVKRSFIGVGIQELPATLARHFDVLPKSGVVVTVVQAGSPGEKSGLQTGDILTSFDNHRIREPSQLQLLVERCEPGQQKIVEIKRAGKQVQLSIIPAQLANQAIVDTRPEPDTIEPTLPDAGLGMRVENLRPEIARQIGVANSDGVVVTAIAKGSSAQQAGLQPGLVISEVNHQPIHNLRDFAAAMQDADANNGILLLVKAGEGRRFLVLKTTG